MSDDHLPESDLLRSMTSDPERPNGSNDQVEWNSRRWESVLKARKYQAQILDLKTQIRMRWRADGDPSIYDPDASLEDALLQDLSQIAQTLDDGQE